MLDAALDAAVEPCENNLGRARSEPGLLEERRIVTLYRGLPYQVLGINLYETYYTSGVPAALVPADRRAALFNHDLRSQTNATKLIMNLELGNVTK